MYGPPSPAAALRMFCLPYAGKGASLYRQWWEASDRRIEFVPVQLPGRENRFRERLVHNLRELVASLAADIAPHTERPYALFGYCMGASIAFELAHQLSDLTGHRPEHLVVAGGTPPHLQRAVSSEKQRTDEELMTELRRLGGTPTAALDDERLLAFALPVLRADWSVVDGYSYRPTPALDVPITVLGSTLDPDVPTDELRQWEHHTNADTRVHVFPGDHFFVDRFPDEVRGLLVSELVAEPADAAPAHGTTAQRAAGYDRDITEALEASGRRALGDVDTSAWTAALHDLDAAALTAMTRAVTNIEDGPSVGGLAERLQVAPRHRWLLDRWVTSLLAEGYAVRRDGALVATNEAAPHSADDGTRVSSACAALGYGDELRGFFLRCNADLPLLLRDKLTVQELWFKGGGFAVAESTYRDNPMARYLNAALAEAVVRHVRNRAGSTPVRVVELGAGIGATTSTLLPMLADTGVEVRYVFSDIAPVFLKAARERFADIPFVEFELIDINDGNGSSTPPADVVLSTNVLHNALDTGATLALLRRMTADDGMLAFVESSREHYQLMASMLFMLSGADGRSRPGSADFRHTENRVCLTQTEWHEQLRRAGFTPAATVPDAKRDPAAVLEQYLYVAFPESA
ncbi:thioesterase domain-containing protein [Streptomyces sp. NPDC005827]|uniref:thioesterase domain-containing protein n=1 Tax=Streptomyces sp. NPDC005827 TaxID=3157070 RepID=UPI0033FD69A4